MNRGQVLLAIARGAIDEGFGRAPSPKPREAWLEEKRAVFVTLKKHGALRGCIGQLSPRFTLLEAVRHAARAAAFEDPRFPPLSADEVPELELEISVLSPLEPLPVSSEEEVLAALRPGVDGVVLTHGQRSGVFIPEVWKELREPREFLAQLKRKAGLPPTWLPGTRVERFTAEVFSS